MNKIKKRKRTAYQGIISNEKPQKIFSTDKDLKGNSQLKIKI
jgi:hypothetical protein